MEDVMLCVVATANALRLSWSWHQSSATFFQKGGSVAAVFAKTSWGWSGKEVMSLLDVLLMGGLLVEGVDHGLGDGFALHLSHNGFFIGGGLGCVVVGECPSITSFLGVKVPVCSRRGAGGHGRDVSG